MAKIKLDPAINSVVVVCSDCPFWPMLRLTMAQAHGAAAAHEKLWHPEDTAAQEAARKYRQRHPEEFDLALDTKIVPPHSADSSAWESSTGQHERSGTRSPLR